MEQQVDREMRAWLMIHAMSKNPPGIFGRKKAEKELREHLAALGVECVPVPVTQTEKQKDFARRYIQLCMKSRSYGSTLLNLIPLSEESTAMKLAREIDAVTRVYPSYFGLEEACAPLRKAIFEVFVEEIEGGAEVLAHLT